jgi:hypothetical protein
METYAKKLQRISAAAKDGCGAKVCQGFSYSFIGEVKTATCGKHGVLCAKCKPKAKDGTDTYAVASTQLNEDYE